MNHILKIAFVAIAVVFVACAHSYAQDLPTAQAKEALLIANGEYTNFGKLPNPIPDARKLAASLRQIGFQVVIVENADREKMLDAIGDFEKRLKVSRGIAFFHYGGHGVQVDGSNYLIPANADIPDEKRVSTRAVDLGEVMSALDASGSAANIVVLDACRDNPLPASTRSATRGLSVVQSKPKNSIIIFAAEAGCKAQDGLLTPILADAITTPGRSITDVIMQVRREVNVKSGGIQTPGEYNQLFNPIVLTGDSQLRPPPNQAESAQDHPEIHQDPDFRKISSVSSYWSHNGSIVGLIKEGESRTFIYVEPRSGLHDLVQPGRVLFSGTSNNKSYKGTASRFRKGLPPIKYQVAGPINKDGAQVVLTGKVTTRKADGSPSQTFEDTLIFNLKE